MQPIVEVNDIEKSYGLKRVINHCSFKIYEGEIYVQVNFYPCIYVICKKKADIGEILRLVGLDNVNQTPISSPFLQETLFG